jgi:hypothetical protein
VVLELHPSAFVIQHIHPQYLPNCLKTIFDIQDNSFHLKYLLFLVDKPYKYSKNQQDNLKRN